MDVNLPRWLKASIVTHFITELDSYDIYVEGAKRSTYSKESYLELRVSNPSRCVMSHSVVRYLIDVNLLVYHTGFENIYDLSDMVGACIATFKQSLVVKEYGGTEDVIGCLTLLRDVRGRDGVLVSDYGIVDRDLNIQQSTVEGKYEIILEN